jgi:hypothetical protein
MTVILRDDPAGLEQLASRILAGLERVVQHCLEKNAAERFQAARDLAFDLENLSGSSSASAVRSSAAGTPLPLRRLLVPAAALIAALALGFGLTRWLHPEVSTDRSGCAR